MNYSSETQDTLPSLARSTSFPSTHSTDRASTQN